MAILLRTYFMDAPLKRKLLNFYFQQKSLKVVNFSLLDEKLCLNLWRQKQTKWLFFIFIFHLSHLPKTYILRKKCCKTIIKNNISELTIYKQSLLRNATAWYKSACLSRKQNLQHQNTFIFILKLKPKNFSIFSNKNVEKFAWAKNVCNVMFN